MDKFVQLLQIGNGGFSIFAFLVCVFFLIRVFRKAQTSATMDWSDLLTVNGTSNKVALPKVMSLIGLVIGSWVVIHLTIMDKLSFDIFGLYLSYVGGVDAYSKFLAMKSKTSNNIIEQNKK